MCLFIFCKICPGIIILSSLVGNLIYILFMILHSARDIIVKVLRLNAAKNRKNQEKRREVCSALDGVPVLYSIR